MDVIRCPVSAGLNFHGTKLSRMVAHVSRACVKDGGVALEHLLSKAGYIASDLRAQLSPDNVKKLVLARNIPRELAL